LVKTSLTEENQIVMLGLMKHVSLNPFLLVKRLIKMSTVRV